MNRFLGFGDNWDNSPTKFEEHLANQVNLPKQRNQALRSQATRDEHYHAARQVEQ